MSGAHAAPSHGDGTMLLVRRSIRRVLGTPANYMPGLIMPLLLIAINAQSLDRAARIPGFPADQYLDFVLVLGFVQTALVATTTAGLGLARDIETGFGSRMSLTPLPSWALVASNIAGSTSAALLAAIVFVVVGLIGGVSFAAGPAGIVLLLVFTAWAAAACSMLGSWLALRSGNGETLQSITPLLFAGLFLSTVNMPLDLIEAGWFRMVAMVNPVTQLVEGMRSLIVQGWDLPALAITAAMLSVLTVLGASNCARSIRSGTLERVPAGPRKRRPPKAAAPRADAHAAPTDVAAPARGIAWRHLHKWLSVPSVFYPSFALPLIFFLGFAGPLGVAGDTASFDYSAGWVTWIFAFALVQSCMYGGVTSGFAIAMDFRTGFARRLLTSVEDRRAILVGFVLASLARGALTSIAMTIAALIIGLRLEGSVLHVIGAFALCWTMSIIATLWAAGVMLRARDPQRAPAMQVPLFIVIFVTPVFTPLEQLGGWLAALATLNPVSYLLTTARSLLVGTADGLGLALVTVAGALALLWWWAASGLRAAERAGA